TLIVTSVTALNELYQIETFRTAKMVRPDGAANSRRPESCRAAGLGIAVWAAAAFCSGCSMTFLALVSGKSSGDDAGGDHEDEGDRDERERRAPAPGLGASVRRRRVREDLRGERGVGA